MNPTRQILDALARRHDKPRNGNMTYSPDRDRLTITRRAPWRDTPLPPYTFMLSLARNLQQTAEAA